MATRYCISLCSTQLNLVESHNSTIIEQFVLSFCGLSFVCESLGVSEMSSFAQYIMNGSVLQRTD